MGEENPTIGIRSSLAARSLYLLLTLALTAFAVAPLAYPGYLQVHSGFVPLYNLADLAAIPLQPGWVPHIATTFDPLRGDGLLAYYLAVPWVALGGAPIAAYAGMKIVFLIGFVLGAAGMFLWLCGLLGQPGACLAALVYTYAPFRIATTYVRGAAGEALYLGLLPFGLAVALLPSTREIRPARLVLAAGIWLMIALSQSGLAVLGWICLALWGLAASCRRQSLWMIVAAALGTSAGVFLNLWAAGWRFESAHVTFAEHYLFPAQLISAFWGFGASRPGWNDGLSLGLGLAPIGLACLALLLVWQRRGKRPALPDRPRPTGVSRTVVPPDRTGTSPLALGGMGGPLLATMVLGILLFEPSDAVWQTGLSALLTYPWQLLGILALCLAVVAGSTTRLARRLRTPAWFAALLVLVLLGSHNYLQPRFTEFQPGVAPYATLDKSRVLVLDVKTATEVPATAAGLPQPTVGRLPTVDYGRPRPGDTLHLLTTWQALRSFDRDLKLFVHVIDSDGRVVVQADPMAGVAAHPDKPGTDYPTSLWEPGRIIVTDVAIALPANASVDDYQLAFGLYDGQTLERLPVDGSEGGALIVSAAGVGDEPSRVSRQEPAAKSPCCPGGLP